jgi:hypothetical protein
VRRIGGNHSRLETRWLDTGIGYTGAELRSHFIREITGVRDDGLVAFTGKCDVSGERLVDLEDAESGSVIVARMMLHFIGEHFQCPLPEGNVRLRLFASILADAIVGLVPGTPVTRLGDDLFIDERKLSVAICTVSPVSAVFHLGVNIDPSGAPVPAVGLDELGVDPRELAERAMAVYRSECESIGRALRKVRGVP